MNAIRGAFARVKIPGGGAAPPGGGAGVTGLILAGLGVYGAYHSVVTVQPGHKGVVYNRFGGLDPKHQLNEGLNFVVPWFQRPIVFDVRTRPQPIDTNSGSKDLQTVTISLRVLFKPDPNELAFIYRRLGKDYDVRVLPSIVNEVTKAVVAQYNASELLTKREQVSRQVRELLTRRSSDFRILLDDVAITHLSFSREYTAAVEAKQVAQQDAERAKYIVDRALQEKKSIVIKAEGEAKSAELIGHAIKKNPAFVQLRKIEASKEIAGTIAQSGNKVYLDSDSLMINTLGQSSLDGGDKKKQATGGSLW
mmetsp:Transcript_32028/g.54016  ORF Transcript_32028/g.54016 Transcript_32028/m.54016 type:complete len:308 (-) Transcript_32028:32-955(-)|eukprot:CAMPEP_0174990900 /NCGR_PEP_ID=MMETSP0004_2-20121128/21580_1 /TAXON_ID=420556 /ORGANISM="Ochromonas sp., Strain CCMP1393" /LENGTH=307 /DNA_ID=CAMNT_0016244563 /DNA_START=58 /DNA_END=981 /DNA_ORIENTATION=+